MIRLDTYSQAIYDLTTWRHTNRISQTHLANLLHIAPQTLGHWENGTRIVPADHLFQWYRVEQRTLYVAGEQPK